jgi:lysozyme family protein
MGLCNWFRRRGKIVEPTPQKTQEPKMNAFNRAMKFVLLWEGGLVDHPSDPGGLTNFGIAQRSHPNVDIRNLTEEGAKEIYREDYWNKVHGDELPPAVALAVMDYAVNSGTGRSAKTLQNVVGAVADGAIGPNTLKKVREAVEQKGDRKIAQAVVMSRSDFLSDLVKRKPEMAAFLKGWMRRTHSCLIAIGEIEDEKNDRRGAVEAQKEKNSAKA